MQKLVHGHAVVRIGARRSGLYVPLPVLPDCNISTARRTHRIALAAPCRDLRSPAAATMPPKAEQASVGLKMAVLRKQKDRAAMTWSAICAQEEKLDDESRDDRLITELVKELYNCPAKIPHAHKAILSDFFLQQDENDDSVPIHHTLTRMHRLPKKFWRRVLETWVPRLMASDDLLRIFGREDRQ